MNRRHTADDYRRTVERLRPARPDLALSSDFIVGYPRRERRRISGPRSISCARSGSRRPSRSNIRRAPAPRPRARRTRFRSRSRPSGSPNCRLLLQQQQRAFNAACVGHVLPVLFEKPGRHDGQLVGRSPYLQSRARRDRGGADRRDRAGPDRAGRAQQPRRYDRARRAGLLDPRVRAPFGWCSACGAPGMSAALAADRGGYRRRRARAARIRGQSAAAGALRRTRPASRPHRAPARRVAGPARQPPVDRRSGLGDRGGASRADPPLRPAEARPGDRHRLGGRRDPAGAGRDRGQEPQPLARRHRVPHAQAAHRAALGGAGALRQGDARARAGVRARARPAPARPISPSPRRSIC